MSTQNIENFLPPVQSDGLNTAEAVSFSNTLTVSGAATLSGGATLSGTNTVSGAMNVSGAATFSGTVATTALANFSGATAVRLPTLAASALSGASVAVQIDVNGTPYYFAAYPTKA